MTEKNIPVEVLKKFREEANLVAEQHVFCNVGEDDYPSDVWSAIAAAAEKGESADEVEGVVVWEPFGGYSASMVCDEMTSISDDVYAAMCHAVKAYAEATA